MLILLVIAAIFGTFIAFKFKGLFHKVISIGQTIFILGLLISILLIRATHNYIIAGDFIVVALLSITTVIYGLTVKGISIFEKISITIMGLFLTNSLIFKLMHYPFAGLIQLSMIVPIIITLTVFIKDRRLTKEMSFMIFWLFYAISKLTFWTL